MPKAFSTTADYRKLLADIRKEMEHGLKRVEELLERQKVLSYWAIGRKISACFVDGRTTVFKFTVFKFTCLIKQEAVEWNIC